MIDRQMDLPVPRRGHHYPKADSPRVVISDWGWGFVAFLGYWLGHVI